MVFRRALVTEVFARRSRILFAQQSLHRDDTDRKAYRLRPFDRICKNTRQIQPSESVPSPSLKVIVVEVSALTDNAVLAGVAYPAGGATTSV